MKRFFTFLLNRLFWLGDFFLLFIELNIELVVRFVYFFLETIQNLYKSIQYFWNLKTSQKYLTFDVRVHDQHRFTEQALVTIMKEIIRGFVLILIIYSFPIFGPMGVHILHWLGYHPYSIICVVVMSIMWYLPQQRIFRDPVTRYFFERGWFENYGEAFAFTQLFSFLVLVWLLITAWSWFGVF